MSLKRVQNGDYMTRGRMGFICQCINMYIMLWTKRESLPAKDVDNSNFLYSFHIKRNTHIIRRKMQYLIEETIPHYISFRGVCVDYYYTLSYISYISHVCYCKIYPPLFLYKIYGIFPFQLDKPIHLPPFRGRLLGLSS